LHSLLSAELMLCWCYKSFTMWRS